MIYKILLKTGFCLLLCSCSLVDRETQEEEDLDYHSSFEIGVYDMLDNEKNGSSINTEVEDETSIIRIEKSFLSEKELCRIISINKNVSNELIITTLCKKKGGKWY